MMERREFLSDRQMLEEKFLDKLEKMVNRVKVFQQRFSDGRSPKFMRDLSKNKLDSNTSSPTGSALKSPRFKIKPKKKVTHLNVATHRVKILAGQDDSPKDKNRAAVLRKGS